MEDANKVFNSKLIEIVLPIAFQQFMLSVVTASDAFMLGMLSQDSMSAVSLAGQIQFIFNLFIWGITGGASIFVAQYWGKGDKDIIEEVLAYILRLAIVVSMLVTLLTFFFPVKIMSILTNDATLIDYGATYLKSVSPSYFLCGVSQMYIVIMKNSGRTKKSSIIVSTCVIINLILNYILIFGFVNIPALGIAGAAIATAITRLIESVWALADSIPEGRIKIRKKYFVKVDGILRKEFWKYTSPLLINVYAWGLGFSACTIIMGHLGSDAVAANSITSIIRSLLVCFCTGLGASCGIILGNELGAGNLDTAKLYGQKLLKLAALSGVITGGVLLILTPVILKFVTLTPDAKYYLKWMLIMNSYYFVGKAINAAAIPGIFCSGGDSKFGLVCDTLTMWAFVVPLGYIAAFVLELPVLAVYFIINLDEIVKIPFVIGHFKKYTWVKNITND